MTPAAAPEPALGAPPPGRPVPARLRKIHVVAFGCQMSAADGEELARPLLERGLVQVADLEDADAVILNTCTVRQHAEDRALSYLGRLEDWKRRRPDAFLIVAGCAAERLGDRLRRRFPHVDLVVGAKSIEAYPELLEAALRRRFDWKDDDAPAWPAGGAPPGSSPGSPASSFVTVMRGCNYSCTYCIVPAVRGRELYRPLATILEETRRRVAGGAKEIFLLGQTVNSYRAPEGGDFADLLRAVGEVPGVERLRFMSPHPRFATPRMLQALAQVRQVCPHLHLPAQSGSDRVLARMRRNYTAASFLAVVDAARRAVPGLAVTTDVIVGFPGETEDDFQASLRLVERLDPASAYCFMFSPREGTEAASCEGAVPEPVKQERLQRLLALVEERQKRHLRAQLGREVTVLLEDERRGRTGHFFNARLDVPGAPGELVRATVTGCVATGLAVSRR
ncbi:MAG: tRNA (N6-isopentenyl adenosine(37)-C2)-methylthiotransferase MiaB [Elusimicrobia bacterium]|nr:tRNA (N6-isopentenyl adenosine(37)-C2)-methylthiotransferase MiaB [Elusimicrobiota bacterium]